LKFLDILKLIFEFPHALKTLLLPQIMNKYFIFFLKFAKIFSVKGEEIEKASKRGQ
jgi:hypothetical protein